MESFRPASIHVFASNVTMHGFYHIFARHHSVLDFRPLESFTCARIEAIIRCEDLLSEFAEREKKESANSLGKKES